MSFKWFEECLACKSKEFYTILDLGEHPLPNKLPSNPKESLNKYPLGLNFCVRCCHIQLFGVPEEPMFEDYSYVNTSKSYRTHQEDIVRYWDSKNLGNIVLDVGGNDGALARAFSNRAYYASVIDPSLNLQWERFVNCVPAYTGYFTQEIAEKIIPRPDLITMCNVLPHTPDPEGMLKAAAIALYPSGSSRILVEFVYAKSTYELRDLGQIYHEHCSYFTLNSLKTLLDRLDMSVNDIMFFPEVHGGTIRVLINPNFQPSDHCPKFYEMLHAENLSGVVDFECLKEWGQLLKDNVKTLSDKALSFPLGRKAIFYGASAKTSTLFNMHEFSNSWLVNYAVDDNPLKQSKYIPGTAIPIKHPSEISKEDNPVIYIGAHNHKADLINRIKALTPKATVVNYVPVIQVEEIE